MVAGLSGAVVLGVARIGHWLVVADPLRPARSIVPLAGDFPFRAVEAARLYSDGWAPEVWLLRTGDPAREAALVKLGLRVAGEEESNRALLDRLGVPEAAVRILDGRVRNTRQEVELIAAELARQGADAVVLVTSKPHSRRVRATWRAATRESLDAVVRFPRDDPFEQARWWANSRDVLAVSREVFGLLNVAAGFPVRPDQGAIE